MTRISLAGLAVAFLPACSTLEAPQAFKALSNFQFPAFQATASSCLPPPSGEGPDAMLACPSGETVVADDTPALPDRPEVAAALAEKYALASQIPNPPIRPGTALQRDAAPLITGSTGGTLNARATPIHDPRTAPIRHLGPIALADAVAHAVLTYPEIRAHEARLREAKAGVDVSNAGFMPTADLRVAAGGNYSGSFEGRAVPYTTANTSVDNRFDGGIVLRQLIWDFGATSSDVARARYLSQSEAFRLREKIDEIAWKTAQTFVKIHEHRALLSLVDETIGAHQNLLRIVMAQEKEGHGTSADVNRVRSRVSDISTIRADVSLGLKAAEDQFERLTRHRPNQLGQVPNYRPLIPQRPEIAIEHVLTKNPRLASMQANNRSIEKELEFQRATVLPRIGLEVDTESKNFRTGIGGRTQIEGRGMLAMRFKLFDGGLNEAQQRQIKARIEGGEMLLLNEREQFEADIRQAYRAIESAVRKGALLAEGVSSARKVRELYIEQFKAGKRTIFELLDGQMALYTARRSQIESQYEIHKAVVDILRMTGDLAPVLAGNGPPSPQKVPPKQRG